MKQCETKYPILLLHGTGGRDDLPVGYWGRIPKALEDRGAVVFFGGQDAWATVARNASKIRKTLAHLVEKHGVQKVNIIAHSKGGLEARHLASGLGCGDRIASITTISTPHHGSRTMDKLWRFPKLLFRVIGVPVNLWFSLLGDREADFFTACGQLTTVYTERFNLQNPDVKGIHYQSYAAAMKNPLSDIFMAFPNLVIDLVEGENDGMVTVSSAEWTNFRGVWRGKTRRGVSHGDAIDLRRKPLPKDKNGAVPFDAPTRYVDIVSELRERGL
ncbi:MAG: esterase/lipase family protein [Oscillospiraceae bacterium]